MKKISLLLCKYGIVYLEFSDNIVRLPAMYELPKGTPITVVYYDESNNEVKNTVNIVYDERQDDSEPIFDVKLNKASGGTLELEFIDVTLKKLQEIGFSSIEIYNDSTGQHSIVDNLQSPQIRNKGLDIEIISENKIKLLSCVLLTAIEIFAFAFSVFLIAIASALQHIISSACCVMRTQVDCADGIKLMSALS